MSAPPDTFWKRDAHTEAKHRLVVRYLHAWFPIMANSNAALNVIDGFAGPGRYEEGEPGSPLLMIDAFVGHGRRTARMDAASVHYDFIELREDRYLALREAVEALSLPPNVKVVVHQGAFDDVMIRILDAIPATHRLAPTFAFIDPFGFKGHSLELSSRILQSRKCEVLIYIPWPFIARFVDQVAIEPVLTRLFGDETWKAARGHAGIEGASILHELFLEKVKKAAGYAVSFEIDASRGKGWAGYTLYFGTGNLVGLERMKEAMWTVDPGGGVRFAYADDPAQMVIFEVGPDLSLLERQLYARFGVQPFSIEAARECTILQTPFAPRAHLKRKVLAAAEKEGRMEAWHPRDPKRRRGNYPPGTLMRFKDDAAG